jgi:hypothetical protein
VNIFLFSNFLFKVTFLTDLQVLGVRRWSELAADRKKKKNGRILFDRPKPTVGCSANG